MLFSENIITQFNYFILLINLIKNWQHLSGSTSDWTLSGLLVYHGIQKSIPEALKKPLFQKNYENLILSIFIDPSHFQKKDIEINK